MFRNRHIKKLPENIDKKIGYFLVILDRLQEKLQLLQRENAEGLTGHDLPTLYKYVKDDSSYIKELAFEIRHMTAVYNVSGLSST